MICLPMVEDNCYITKSPIREAIECEKYAKIANIGHSLGTASRAEFGKLEWHQVKISSWKIKVKTYGLSNKISHLPLSGTAQTFS